MEVTDNVEIYYAGIVLKISEVSISGEVDSGKWVYPLPPPPLKYGPAPY